MSQRFKLLEQSPSVEEYQTLRNAVRWSPVSDQAVERSLKNSLYTVCAYIGKKIVGYGRVIGDGGIYYYIQDVIVLPEFQGRGIGRKIMISIMNYLEDADPSAFFGLMAAKNFSSFYKPYGFKERPPDAPGMFRYCQSK